MHIFEKINIPNTQFNPKPEFASSIKKAKPLFTTERCVLLKNKKGRWVEILEITEELWKKMMQETLFGVIELLNSAEKLLQNGGSEAICAGLYTYAVEEYGKLLLLLDYGPSGGKVKIKYKDEFRNHEAKFRAAIKHLPDECKTLHEGAFSQRDFSRENFDTDVVADFDARKAIFYSDFADSGDDIKPVPSVDKDRLKKAINQLKTKAFGTTIP